MKSEHVDGRGFDESKGKARTGMLKHFARSKMQAQVDDRTEETRALLLSPETQARLKERGI